MPMSMISKIIREGILAALTGGYFFDPSQSHFINIVHIYIWLGLFILPFIIGLFAPSSYLGWIAYCLTVGITICVIKVITQRLHNLFDTSEAIEEDSTAADSSQEHTGTNFQHNENDSDDEDDPYPFAAYDIESGTQLGRPNVLDSLPSHTLTDESPVFSKRPSNVISGDSTPLVSAHTSANTIQHGGTTSSVQLKLYLPTRTHRSTAVTSTTVAAVTAASPLPSTTSPGGVQLVTTTTTVVSPSLKPNASIRPTAHDYSQQMEALKRDVSRLPIPSTDFEPSTADLELLDTNPTTRNLVKSISRSRSSSQRRRPSLRSSSSRLGAPGLVGGLHSTLTGVSTVPNTTGTEVSGCAVARSQSLRQTVVARRLQQQLPGRRTQSFRRDEPGKNPSPVFSKPSPMTTGTLGGKESLEEEPGTVPVIKAPIPLSQMPMPPHASLSEFRLSGEDSSDLSDAVLSSRPQTTTVQLAPPPTGVKGTTSSQESLESVISMHSWLAYGAAGDEPRNPKSKNSGVKLRAKDSRTVAVRSNSNAADEVEAKPSGPGRRRPQASVPSNPGGSSTTAGAPMSPITTANETAPGLVSALQVSNANASTSDRSFAEDPATSRLRLVRRSCIRRRHRQRNRAGSTPDPTTDISRLQGAQGGEIEDWLLTSSPPVPTSTAPALVDSEGVQAATHEDTSDGSVHFFRDENGQLMVYVFGDGRGTAFTRREWLERMNLKRTIKEEEIIGEDLSGLAACSVPSASDLVPSDDPNASPSYQLARARRRNGSREIHDSQEYPTFLRPDSPHPEMVPSSFGMARANRRRNAPLEGGSRDGDEDSQNRLIFPLRTLTWDDRTASFDLPRLDRFSGLVGLNKSNNQRRKIQYYRLQLFPWFTKLFKIRFDRLQLGALFDRSLTMYEVVLSIFLGMLVAILGCIVIHKGFFLEIQHLFFCATIAGCQYSLIKSVQPDAATPQHGFNRIIVFSRAAYFSCLCCILLITNAVVGALSPPSSPAGLHFYTIPVNLLTCFTVVRDAASYLLLGLPVFFMLGLLPQVNTFAAYALEQIDIHVFGASGTAGVFSVLFSLFRNVLAVAISYGLCYGGIKNGDPQHVAFSVFWGVQLALCYFLSRLPSNVSLYMELFPRSSRSNPAEGCSTTQPMPSTPPPTEEIPSVIVGPNRQSIQLAPLTAPPTNRDDLHPTTSTTTPSGDSTDQNSFQDPLPQLIRRSLLARLKNDAAVCLFMGVLGFAVHVSTAFTAPALRPNLQTVAVLLTVSWGFLLHYIWPQLRKPYPWLLLAKPIITPDPHGALLTSEKIYIWFLWIERNLLVPLVTMASVTKAVGPLYKKFGPVFASFVIILTSMKMLRNGFQGTSRVFFVLFFTFLLFSFDFEHASETFPIDYFFTAIVFAKVNELLLKLRFIFVYIAPLQISWGSAFHAFAQLSFVPHSMFLLGQCILSALLSSPLEPFLASAIFLTSYVRPIKFWEEDYKTKRAETTNVSLASQVEGTLETVSENLNAIFYEHLTRSLQRFLAGDILLGRWGNVSHGDVFILASEDLHFLVHIIELGNGLVTFQLRGLEFVGTYCHEQETEELRTDMHRDTGLCCCSPGRPPGLLSLNAAFHLRWVAWQVVNTPYFLDGYRVTDHSASTSLQLFDFRKLVILFYVQCIIYYTIRLPNISQYLESLAATLTKLSASTFVDLDPIFNKSLDEDYDDDVSGVSRKKFVEVHLPWIQYCVSKREDAEEIPCEVGSPIVSLCFGLSLLGRRCLGGISPEKYGFQLEFFLHGLHSVFKGDIRVLTKDDWVFQEIDLLKTVIGPAVRIAIKLYHDHFACASLSVKSDLYLAIKQTERNFVICHETHPMWRFAVLNDADSLFSFRRICKVANDGYRIIMLSKKKLQFRVVKINSECVRGLWAGQQQEQIFLRNNDPERGSIQHAKQVLRNLINSSCDLPIGYPIFISPLTTSFAGTSEAYSSVAGHEFSLDRAVNWIRGVWNQLRWRCNETCFTPSGEGIEMTSFRAGPGGPNLRHQSSPGHLSMVPGGSSAGAAVGVPPSGKGAGKMTLSALIHQQQMKEGEIPATVVVQPSESSVSPLAATTANSPPLGKVKIIDAEQVLNDKHNKLAWPSEEWKSRVVTNLTSPIPLAGVEGTQVHRWTPSNPDMSSRSFCHKSIALVRLALFPSAEDRFLVVYEAGVQPVREASTSNLSLLV